MPRPPSPPSADFDELDRTAAAAYLGCHVRTLNRAVKIGLVPAPKVTFAGPRYVRCDLDEAKRDLAERSAYWRSKLNRLRAKAGQPTKRRKPVAT